jgi:putative endonuclease
MIDNADNHEKNWVVYLVRCCDDSLYCGITNDLPNRIKAHNKGTGAKYTRGRGPIELVAHSIPMSHYAAARLECLVKSVNHNDKINVIQLYGR